ncbi:MAG: RNA methyltransferase [Porticoccaceae bacterium]|nr:RNA methyltransferase [Porticoccaceae bacterium]
MKNHKTTAKQRPDSAEYLSRKAFYDQLITVYGRKPVIEVLRNRSLQIYRIHLASSNRDSSVIREIKQLTSERGVEIVFHNRSELSRISRNSKQDQGVACDIHCPGFKSYRQALADFKADAANSERFSLIALDGVTNPQNLGMIIRSVTASPAQGLLLPSKGSSDISPLVIKASAGTVFKGNILRCDCLLEALKDFQESGFKLCTLSSHDATPIAEFKPSEPTIFILGNESQGVSREIIDISDYAVGIPMANGVESLNVAVAAALVAFNY